MKGRKPKSAGAQMSAGDPSKRGMGKLEERLAREPKAREGLPEAPAHLGAVARELWATLVAELEHMSLDRRPDAVALEGVCVAYSIAVAAEKAVEAEGVMIPNVRMTSKGDEITLGSIPHPALSVAFRAWTQVRHFATEFGLTPVSRGRLSLEKQPENTAMDLAELLAGPRRQRELPKVQ